jgi:formate dehydrogenase iron-sulfur subunit
MSRMARLIDITRCTACRGCQVSCKRWNELEGEIGSFTGSYQSHSDLSPNRWTMIKFFEEKKETGFEWHFRKTTCMHCGDAGCVRVCPNGALVKAENGAVRRIEEKCVGCGYCTKACPFNIPRVDETDKKMRKCTFCYDRISNGLTPACAKTCVPQAIVYGTWDDMAKLADERLAAAKGRYPKSRIYGKTELQGLGVIYILPDSADKYGLPVNPQIPHSLELWKEVVQPFGKLLLGVTLAGTALAFIISRRHAFKQKPSGQIEAGGGRENE